MRLLRRLLAYARIFPRGHRNTTDALRFLVRRPALLAAIGGYEVGVLLSNRVDPRLKHLAGLKAASLTGCPFWLDIGSAVCRALGIDEATLVDLSHYAQSDRFTPLEKAALDLAVEMTGTPAQVSDGVRRRLLAELTPGQFAELASSIAWENHRARLNRALEVRAMGFAEGGFCLLPERAPAGSPRDVLS